MPSADVTINPASYMTVADVIQFFDWATDVNVTNDTSTSFTLSGEFQAYNTVATVTGVGLVYGHDGGDTFLIGGTIQSVSISFNGVLQATITTNFDAADYAIAADAEYQGTDYYAIENFFLDFNWTVRGSDASDYLPPSLMVGDGAPFNLRGNDVFHLEGGDDTFFAGDGNDTVYGDAGSDSLYGGAGDDALHGGTGGDFLFGNKGNDLIAPGAGADQVDGGLGLDRVWYGDSAGGVTVDLTTGTGARSDAAGDTYVNIERVTGSAFSDSIVGNALGNALKGGAGDDIIYGKDGRDVIEGQAGKDQLYGGAGNDNILGGDGNDKLFGNSGLDKLYGGAGNDQLTGGADADYFVFETNGATGFGGDIVYDFQNGIDKLDMRGVYRTSDPGHTPIGFADLTIGAWGDGVKIVVQNNQIVYLDHAATGITVADIDAGDFLFA